MEPKSYTRAAKASQEQFGQQASFYAKSITHRNRENLAVITKLANLSDKELVLDVATGVGFTAFALAPTSKWVMGTDITEPMLKEALVEQKRQRIQNVSFGLASAEQLPFKSDSFDRVVCRTAIHHFGQPEMAILEMARVLAPRGFMVLMDTISPENTDTSEWMDEVEQRRDPSHRRNLTSNQLESAVGTSGVQVIKNFHTYIPLSLKNWALRSGTSPDTIAKLFSDFQHAPENVINSFNIKIQDGDALFSWPCAILQAVKPPMRRVNHANRTY